MDSSNINNKDGSNQSLRHCRFHTPAETSEGLSNDIRKAPITPAPAASRSVEMRDVVLANCILDVQSLTMPLSSLFTVCSWVSFIEHRSSSPPPKLNTTCLAANHPNIPLITHPIRRAAQSVHSAMTQISLKPLNLIKMSYQAKN